MHRPGDQRIHAAVNISVWRESGIHICADCPPCGGLSLGSDRLRSESLRAQHALLMFQDRSIEGHADCCKTATANTCDAETNAKLPQFRKNRELIVVKLYNQMAPQLLLSGLKLRPRSEKVRNLQFSELGWFSGEVDFETSIGRGGSVLRIRWSCNSRDGCKLASGTRTGRAVARSHCDSIRLSTFADLSPRRKPCPWRTATRHRAGEPADRRAE